MNSTKRDMEMKPRLNKASLIRMAERNRTSIQASAYKNKLLNLIHAYLSHVLDQFQAKEHHPEELSRIEKDLEAIEAALVHLCIFLPYNEALFIPRSLPEEHVGRIENVLAESRRLNRHLRIAHNQAA